jgi:hypothetical protein
MKKSIINMIIIAITGITVTSCQKDFLEAKPDKLLVIPTTLADLQNLLDNAEIMNQAPFLSNIASDDIYTTTAGYNGAQTLVKNSYLWKSDVYQGQAFIGDWNTPYQCVYYANLILEGAVKLDPSTAGQKEIDRIKGQALFYRSMAFFTLAQEFALAYDKNTADQELGIPVRLSSDVQQRSTRATLKQTYDQIVADLNAAAALLPATTSFHTQPVKAAAFALLARVYLVMGNYQQAQVNADACLNLKNKLLDYNSLTATATRPFPLSFKDKNDEVIYYHSVLSIAFLSNPSVTLIDSNLYNSYQPNDLRKTIFFNNKGKGIIVMKGNYTGASGLFAGLATDEILLIRAESFARQGKTSEAVNDLNTLLIKRWKTSTFTPITAANSDEALQLILTERRKELVYRNLRWSDLKRLNSDPKTAVTIKRIINGSEYLLLPNDKKYAFPLPDAETAGGLPQNPR